MDPGVDQLQRVAKDRLQAFFKVEAFDLECFPAAPAFVCPAGNVMKAYLPFKFFEILDYFRL